jgi:glycosyltransferase involved in cell wall biosynthesis
MKINQPLVSIGIPYYNAERYIIQTLESVKQQTYKNLELILVNDCSTDNCQLLVEQWLKNNKVHFTNVIHTVNIENRGVAYSSKLLQRASSGIYFSKLDADDLILPSKIFDQVNFLEVNPETALVYSNTLLINDVGQLLAEDYFTRQKFSTVSGSTGPGGYVFDKLLLEDFIPTSSVLLRKEALEEVGGYDENLYIEDWDMWLRIAKKYQIQFMDGYYSKYRIHPESMMQKRSSLIKVFSSLNVALLKHISISNEFDKIIAKHIYTYTVGLYRYGEIDENFLWVNLVLNRNIKSLFYFLMGLLNIRVNQKYD